MLGYDPLDRLNSRGKNPIDVGTIPQAAAKFNYFTNVAEEVLLCC